MDEKFPLLPLRARLSVVLTKAQKVANIPRVALILKISILTTYALFSRKEGHSIDYRKTITAAVKGKKGVFIQDFFDNEIDGSLRNGSIFTLCAETKWVPGLIFKCEPPEGGVGNVRNVFLNCLRYSIEAGATGFVIPEMLALTSGTKTSTVPFGHFFDLTHFTTSLTNSCPQIQIYNNVNDLYDIPSTSPAIPIVPTSFNDTAFVEKHILAEPAKWSASFFKYLNKAHPIPPSAALPLLISVKGALLEFPLSYDTTMFVSPFGRLLRFREDTRRLAAVVFYAMAEKHALPIDFTSSESGIVPAAFYGAHLRTGNDATTAGWTTYDIQSANYLHDTTNHGLGIMYVASGNTADVARLTQAAISVTPPIVVETKESLLAGQYGPVKGYEKEWAGLGTLGWDRRLLVDHLVLLRASVFGGTWESSFGWSIAMRRHVVVGEGAWRVISKRDEEALSSTFLKERYEVVGKRDGGGGHSGLETHLKHHMDSSEKGISRIQGRRPGPDAPAGKEPAGQEEMDESEIKAEAIKGKGSGRKMGVGEKAFSDGLSTIFGPAGNGRRIVGSMWP